MGVIHRFTGRWGETFRWKGARFRHYGEGASKHATETWLIGKAEGAENFAIRYYELEPGGHSREEHHPHDHGIVILRGRGQVILSGKPHEIAQGDVIYIPPEEPHQIANTGDEPLGWLCVIPARRRKGERIVWAEEGLDDLITT
ncbi:MAG TPA: cupin domain-containing protein [Chloroflexi bacterium]|nr:cupin domain-containing protein [Chloroflexota bacterium]